MMISPDSYIKELNNKSYKDLVEERKKLLKDIDEFENKFKMDLNNIADDMCPSPDVVYQCNLLYLSKLCNLIAEKFNKEFEWGD